MATLAAEHHPISLRWTRERYYSALDSGVIRRDDKVELIGGQIVTQGTVVRIRQRAKQYWFSRRCVSQTQTAQTPATRISGLLA